MASFVIIDMGELLSAYLHEKLHYTD